MLDRLVIKGFKSIKEADLRLNSLNVLIGANGSGKSNFISLFHLINRITENRLQLFTSQSGGANALLYFGRKATDEIRIKLDFGQNSYEFALSPTLDNSFFFSDETCFFHDRSKHEKPFEHPIGSGHKETKMHDALKSKHRGIVYHVLENMKSWIVYHFHDTSESSRMKQPGNINDNFALRPDASNLAAFLFFLSENHRQSYENIVDTVCMAAPFFDDFTLRPNPMNKEMIQLEWREKESDAYFNAHSLSDGTLRFICLATLLHQPNLPSTILLDEPELGLHPYAITLLASLLRSAAKKTQVVVATQSVTLVNQFDLEDIIVVDREEKQSVFRHLDRAEMKNWLEDYGLGDLWEKNIIGGRPAHE